MAALSAPLLESDRIEAFKRRTQDKLRGIECPFHKQAPRLVFHGSALRDVTITMSACCNHLARIANQAIASVR